MSSLARVSTLLGVKSPTTAKGLNVGGYNSKSLARVLTLLCVKTKVSLPIRNLQV